jgi:hypothetical protein
MIGGLQRVWQVFGKCGVFAMCLATGLGVAMTTPESACAGQDSNLYAT